MPPSPRVMIATPCFGGLVTQAYMLSVLKLLQHAPTAGFTATLSLLGYDSLVPRARSTLLAAFMDDPAATHIMFIDADLRFDVDQFERLLRLDKDFVGALYPIKHLDWARVPERFTSHGETLQQAALNYVGTFCSGDEMRSENGFVTGIYVGGGFQLIRRTVVERMFAAYPATRYSNVHIHPKPAQDSSNQYALFDPMIDPDNGAYLSEDYAFCRRWRAIGGEIWLDTASRLTHVGVHDYVGDFASRLYSLADIKS